MNNLVRERIVNAMLTTGICPIIASDLGLRTLWHHHAEIGKALLDAGVQTLEIAYRESDVDVLELMETVGPPLTAMGISVGLGTCEKPVEAARAMRSGATFIVSPGFNLILAQHCRLYGLLYIPGVMTPTEMRTAYDHGFKVLKMYPAPSLRVFKSLKDSFARGRSDVRFIISGQEPNKNDPLGEYRKWYQAGGDVIVHGSTLFSEEILRKQDWDALQARAFELQRSRLFLAAPD